MCGLPQTAHCCVIAKTVASLDDADIVTFLESKGQDVDAALVASLTEDDKTNINSLFVSELVEVSPGLEIHPTVLRDNFNKIIEKLDSLEITNRIKSVTTATKKLNEIKNILEDKKLSLMKPLKTLEYIDKKLDKELEEKFDMKKIVKEIKEELKKDFRIDEGK